MSRLTIGRTAATAGLAVALCLAGGAPRADDSAAAVQVVRSAVDHVLEDADGMRKLYETDRVAFYKRMTAYISPAVDMEQISRLALGAHWAALPAADKTRFQQAFRDTLFGSYGKAVVLFRNVSVEYLPQVREAGGGKYRIVRTRVRSSNPDPVEVDYVLARRQAEWKIIDLLVDGLSLMKQFRQSFGEEIKRDGVAALIARLETSAAGP